ncbi:glycosyltransferase [Clostridium paraputrificum]|uniref:glycosyltransferase n=1 Tax=Clostridium paraputrificum TaxID=29363 RepID=UPI00164E1FDE|nr:glycosyltransferase [Clostridium paraputrificum]
MDNGPGIANRSIYENLKDYKNVYFSLYRQKIARLFECIFRTFKSDIVVFISSSNLNRIILKICKMLNKKTVYLMHGLLHYEYKINAEEIDYSMYKKYEKFDYIMVSENELVICVSNTLKVFLSKKYPEFSNKFVYNYNGILNSRELSVDRFNDRSNGEDSCYTVISVGGGMKRKNNLMICKAIEYINKKYNLEIKFICIGLNDVETNSIKSFEFVQYYEKLSHNEVIKYMQSSDLYIQNSSFETFGLSVIEALLSGCDILVSNNVGALGVFSEVDNNNIIYDINNIEEIGDKIYHLLLNPNNKKMKENLQHDLIDPNKSANNLLKKIEESLNEY